MVKLNRKFHIRTKGKGKGKVRKNPRKSYKEMIGDGNLPNRYWVSYSNDFLICKDGSCDWVGDHIKFKSKGKTISHAFKTYAEARAFAQRFIDQMTDSPTRKSINRVDIEDRLSGEVYECTIYAYPTGGMLGGYHTKIEEREDIGFTKKKMEERGFKFE
jgi:hypothetical protein